MEKTQAEKNIRIPPQDIEAEVSTLGSIMIDKDAIYRVIDFLSAQDFYKPAHQTIYETVVELTVKNEPVDIISTASRLKEKKKLAEIGGSAYLTSLVNAVPTASNIEYYASIVRKKSLLRKLIEASSYIAELGYNEEREVEQIIDEAEQRIFNIAQNSIRQDFLAIGNALEEAWDRIESLHKGDGALRGVPTGFSDLDSYLSGLQKSDLIVLAARPSLGKTSLGLNIARNAAVYSKVPVGIFSLEMSKAQITDRLIASEASVDLWRLRTGRLRSGGADEQNDFVRIRDAMETLSKAPLFIDDTPSPTVNEIRAKARRLQAKHGLGLIIIDYLQLIKGSGRTESRVQEVSEISRSLKGLAKELDVPVLALSQLSRGVEMRPRAVPKLSDLRESGSIEQDSDVVMFIYREDKYYENSDKPNIAQILIEKHRNGPTGRVELYFHEQSATFRSIEKHFDSGQEEEGIELPI